MIVMDTSERYIEMCRQAKEIQDSWKATVGDYFWHKKTDSWNGWKKGVDIIVLNSDDGYYGCDTTMFDDADNKNELGFIILPRQDQLQAILNLNLSSIGKELNYMSVFDDEDGSSSYEILLLKMVMKYEFKKRWDFDKNEWVAINV